MSMGDAWTDPVSNPLLAAIMSWRSQKCQASADVARKSLARRAEHEHNVLAVRQDVLSHTDLVIRDGLSELVHLWNV
jgi:hypothetical protein